VKSHTNGTRKKLRAIVSKHTYYHNPSLGLATKARACEGACQVWSPGSTFHVPGSVGECEGMNPHTPKWTPTFGVGILMDSWIFENNFKGLNPLDQIIPYIIRNLLKFRCLKWVHMTHLDPLKHKLWPKEGLRIKLAIWLQTTKSQESTQVPYVQVACHILLESSWQGLQLCLRNHFNQSSAHKIMGPQSCGSPNFGNVGIPTWESRDKMTFGCWSCGQAQSIL